MSLAEDLLEWFLRFPATQSGELSLRVWLDAAPVGARVDSRTAGRFIKLAREAGWWGSVGGGAATSSQIARTFGIGLVPDIGPKLLAEALEALRERRER